VHGHAEAAGAVHLEEGAAAGDDREHAGHLEVHDAIADLGLVSDYAPLLPLLEAALRPS